MAGTPEAMEAEVGMGIQTRLTSRWSMSLPTSFKIPIDLTTSVTSQPLATLSRTYRVTFRTKDLARSGSSADSEFDSQVVGPPTQTHLDSKATGL